MPVLSFIANRRSLIVFILVLFHFSLFTFHFSLASAQVPLAETKVAYNDQFAKYTNAHEAYVTSKARYQTFKTTAAKNELFITTKGYLQQVDSLYIAYFIYLQAYTNSLDWPKTTLSKTDIDNVISSELKFVTIHKDTVFTTKTLEDLPPVALILKTRLNSTTYKEVDKVLAKLEIAKTDVNYVNFVTLASGIDVLVTTRLVQSNPTVLANYKTEIAEIDLQIKTNIDSSKAILEEFNIKKSDLQKKQIFKITGSATDNFDRVVELFEEILRLI